MSENILNLFSIVSGQFLWSLFTFIFVISVLVFFHELGHYLAARSVGIYVKIFSIGFGRELFGWNDKNGTRWKVSLIPLGGYVSMYGMTGEMDEKDIPQERRHEAFVTKTVLQRMWVVFAGPLANFILALVFLVGLFYFVGGQKPLAVIGSILPEMPAVQAGLQPGDEIISINGQNVTYWEEVSTFSQQKEPLTLDVYRAADNSRLQVTLTPKEKEISNIFGETEKRYLMGVTVGSVYERVRYSLPEAVVQGAVKTYNQGTAILKIVWRMVSGQVSPEVGGPLTIGKVAGEQALLGWEQLILFMAFISVNLGVFNLLPVPVLDGGHLLYFMAEGILRRPLKESFQVFGNRVGFTLVITLMVFAFYKDIMNVVLPAIKGF